MDKKLIKRIIQFNKIKYGNDNETRIVFARLKLLEKCKKIEKTEKNTKKSKKK